jgi:predicted PurR-regulated permease PerM
MGIDIFSFGWGMKQIGVTDDRKMDHPLRRVLPNRFGKKLKRVARFREGLFRPAGMTVLLSVIVGLLIIGWWLVSKYVPHHGTKT